MERAYAEVDLKKFRQNLRKVQRFIGPEVKVMAVVKADAYGHGAIEISRAAVLERVDYLGVAWVAEAEILRNAGLGLPILVLSEPAWDKAAEKIVALDLTQTVYTFEFASVLNKAAKKLSKKVKIHIKVDSGMGRIGVQPEETRLLIKKIQNLKNLEIEGIFTHFANADETENHYTLRQFKVFEQVLENLENLALPPLIKHAANSAATFNFPKTHLDLVRVGLCLYEDVLTFKTRVTFVKKVVRGQRLGYGGTFITRKPTAIATVSAGYADGLPRLLSNQGSVLLTGQRYPLVGLISMDMSLIDLGKNSKIKIGEEAVLIGQQKKEKISIDEVARLSKTISYEIMCGIGKRVPRIYKED